MMKIYCNVCNKYRNVLGLITNIEEYQKIYNHA